MPTLEHSADLFVLDLGDTENRFHPDWLASDNDRLDEVDKKGSPGAPVVTARGKFFSNGLGLDWLCAHADRRPEYVSSVQALFARVLAMPVVTVAAIQGHTFAAGAMLSLACDFTEPRHCR